MYIELFLLDNLLMNLLIVRLAAALLSVRPPLYRQAAAAFGSAVFAAFAAYLWPFLASIWLRPLLLAGMALALPFTNARGFVSSCVSTLFATFVVGGAALTAALISGGGIRSGFITGGITLRSALLGALAASFLPRAARRLLKRRTENGSIAVLTVEHKGLARCFAGLKDTGNGLVEPVTGLPVAVVRCAAFKGCARLPIRLRTAAGEHVLYAFRPERCHVDGVRVDCLIAVSDAQMSVRALIPPELCGAGGE